MRKLRQGDHIIVIAGKDKGKRGMITRVLPPKKRKYGPQQGLRVLVAGINMVRKHQRANSKRQQAGGIVDMEAPMDLSNVAIWNAGAEKADRVGFRFLEDGSKVRYFKSNGELVDLNKRFK